MLYFGNRAAYRWELPNYNMHENVLINTGTYGIISDFLLKERSIFICQEIDAEVAGYVVTALFYFDRQSTTDEINLYLNSCGGTVSDGFFAIYDAMMGIEAPIRTICIGHAYSAAAEILAAGTPGMRVAYPNAQIMIHDVQVSDVAGSKKVVEKEIERMLDMNKRATELLAQHTGKSLKEIEEDCEEDLYMTAKEALDYGIIDEIVKPVKKCSTSRKARRKAAKKKKVSRGRKKRLSVRRTK